MMHSFCLVASAACVPATGADRCVKVKGCGVVFLSATEMSRARSSDVSGWQRHTSGPPNAGDEQLHETS